MPNVLGNTIPGRMERSVKEEGETSDVRSMLSTEDSKDRFPEIRTTRRTDLMVELSLSEGYLRGEQ